MVYIYIEGVNMKTRNFTEKLWAWSEDSLSLDFLGPQVFGRETWDPRFGTGEAACLPDGQCEATGGDMKTNAGAKI